MKVATPCSNYRSPLNQAVRIRVLAMEWNVSNTRAVISGEKEDNTCRIHNTTHIAKEKTNRYLVANTKGLTNIREKLERINENKINIQKRYRDRLPC